MQKSPMIELRIKKNLLANTSTCTPMLLYIQSIFMTTLTYIGLSVTFCMYFNSSANYCTVKISRGHKTGQKAFGKTIEESIN